MPGQVIKRNNLFDFACVIEVSQVTPHKNRETKEAQGQFFNL